MDVRLPDGTIVRNVPDDITQEDLMARVSAFHAEGMPGPRGGGIGGYLEETAGNVPQDLLNIAQGVYDVAADPVASAMAAKEALTQRPLETASRMGSAALQGVGQFLTQPAETFKQAPVSTALGLTAARGLVGPAMAGAGGVGGVATPMIRNLLNPKARMYSEAFGAQMPEAINALAAARPGMTSAQALADINAPAIQAIGEKITQQVPQEARAVQQAQEASRAARIGQIAGTPEELAAAQEARSLEAKTNYGRAFKQVMQETPELTDIMNRPSMEKAFGRAAQIAEERAKPFQIGKTTPETISESKILDEFGRPVQKVTPAEIAKYPVQSLHYVKMALDDMIRDPKDFGIGATEVAAIRDTRKAFISELEKNPAYARARSEYAAQSVPINKMQVAQELQKSLTAPLTGEATRAGMFARAAEEAPKTIKRATGQEFFTKLEDVLSPEEMGVVNDVRDEFRRTQLAKDQAKLAKASAEDLASAQVGPISHLNLLNRVWTIANTIVRRSLGKIDEKIATQIGMEMLDPAEMRKALQAAEKYNARTEELRRGVSGRRAPAPPVVSGAVTFLNAMTPENRNAMAR